MKKIILMIALSVFVSTLAYSAPKTKESREAHNQKYTLKRRKKAGGVYKHRTKNQKKCFFLLNIEFCKTIKIQN